MSDGKNALSFVPGGTGAVSRTIESKFRERISVTDFMGVLTTSAAIQAAVDQASSVGGDVDFGAGTYTVTMPGTSTVFPNTHAFGATLKYAILMRSNVRFIGRGAIIKVADNISSRASPQNFAVFYSESSLSNIMFDGLTIDLNSANNYFSPDPTNTGKPQEDLVGTPGRYLRYHQAAIFFEGPAGKGDDITVQNCTFKNGNGVSTIICGRLGNPGVGRRWRIQNCNFLELGLDTYDHSSIFLWCDDATVAGCVWRNAAIYAPTTASRAGINSAVEVHGANTICRGNIVDGANRGFFVTENSYGRVEAVKVIGNILRRIKYCGIDIAFDGSGGMGSARLVEVTDNTIDMTSDDTNLADETIPTGVQYFGLDSVVAPIESLVIARNEMKRPASTSGRACQGVGISLQAAGFGMIDVLDNGATGFTRGAYLVTGSATTAETITFARNRWRNPNGGTQAAPYGTSKIGTFMLAQGGLIQRMHFDDQISDIRAPVACTLTDTGDLVTAVGHGLENGETLVFDDITTTTGAAVGTVYFVINKTANTFQISLTSGGSAVALTTNGTAIYKANKWAFGIAAQISGTPKVRLFEVARTARFDQAMPFTNQISLSTLTVNRLLGVPVTIVYTSGGAILPANGSGFNGTIPGCGLPGDKLEFMDITPISPSTWSGPNNPDWFSRKVSATNVNTVRYHITNTLGTNADPGTHSVAVVNYAR